LLSLLPWLGWLGLYYNHILSYKHKRFQEEGNKRGKEGRSENNILERKRATMRNSARANGGSSLPGLRTLDPPLGHRMIYRKSSGESVRRVTFKHLPNPSEVISKVAQPFDIAGGSGVPNFCRASCQVLEPWDNF
jgi:hypothetical protein